MRITPPKLGDGESPTFDDDKLDRKPFGENLTRLISQISEPMVVLIDAPWGEGKTTFAAMLKHHLENLSLAEMETLEGATAQPVCVYVDAFKLDYMEDAFEAITVQINHQLKAAKCIDDDLRESFLGKAKAVMFRMIPTVAKFTTGLFARAQIPDSPEAQSAMETAAEKMAGSAMEHFKSREGDLNTIEEFTDELEKVSGTIRDKTHMPLVIIVDELDRCKPTFAIEVIEAIKHFFSVEQTVFLLMANTDQLKTSLCSVYGFDLPNAGKYLQKFITLHTSLPKDDTYQGARHYDKYSQYLAVNMIDRNTDTQWPHEREIIVKEISLLARYFKFSLREIDKCFSYLALYCSLIPGKMNCYRQLLAIAICLKVYDTELYQSIVAREINPDAFLLKTGLPETDSKDSYQHRLYRSGLFVRTLLMEREEYDQFKESCSSSEELEFVARIFDRHLEMLPSLSSQLDAFTPST